MSQSSATVEAPDVTQSQSYKAVLDIVNAYQSSITEPKISRRVFNDFLRCIAVADEVAPDFGFSVAFWNGKSLAMSWRYYKHETRQVIASLTLTFGDSDPARYQIEYKHKYADGESSGGGVLDKDVTIRLAHHLELFCYHVKRIEEGAK